jgi:predicted phosphodiesterase
VLADAREAGADRFVLGGDYALFGAFPEETVARLRDLDAVWIRGNTDRWLEDDSDAPDAELVRTSLDYCRHRLGSSAGELVELPPTTDLGDALVCHASPRSDMLSFAPGSDEGDARLLADDDPDVIVFGHTHIQFQRPSGARRLVNPGSVGLPFDGDRRAAYALRGDAGEFDLRRVDYDAHAYAQTVREHMSQPLGEGADTLARRVEQAAFVS